MPRIAACLPAIRPCRSANSAIHRLERGIDGAVGEVGERLSRAAAPIGAGQQPHADQEFLLGGEDAQPVEHFLVGIRVLRAMAAEPRRQIGAVRHGAEKAPDRAARRRSCGRRVMMSASRGAAPMIVCNQQRRIPVLAAAARTAGCRPAAPAGNVERTTRLSARSALAERLEQRRRQFGQPRSRASADCVARYRPKCQSRMTPATVARPLEAELLQCSRTCRDRRVRR